MRAIKAVLFDLDGTLTQSEEGIWNCVRYAAEKMGRPEPDAATLRRFIGPPLFYSFQTYLGMTEEEAGRAVDFYRERYNVTGLLENRVYPGIRRVLARLKRAGCYLGIATGKPQVPTERILRHFRLDGFFDAVAGTRPEDTSASKELLIRRALPANYAGAVMVGDRRFDVEGARAVGIDSVGVGYGYGDEEELRTAGCGAYAPTVAALEEILCGDAPVPRGFFLSMEGPDGSGKTTQVQRLEDRLLRFGYDVYRTREPGGCGIAEKIRQLLLDPANAEMTDVTEALLYAAARAQHVRQVIRPALAAGRLVLCDRFVDSSVAYQGGGRNLGVAQVKGINAPAVDGTMPDATVYLDIDHVTAMKRRSAATTLDRLELQAESFHGRVEAAYGEIVAAEPERFVKVDAAQAPDKVAEDIWQRVLERLTEAEA